MGTINHRKVTILPDDPASDISADEWNDALVVRGSDLTGALLARETGAVDGWSAIPAAAGILNCTGAGTLPTWSTSITLTGAINAGSLTTSGAVSAGSLTTTGVVTAGGLLTASGGITTSGPLLFSPDNTYDLGASGATRPRTGYFGTSVAIGTSPATTGALNLANGSGSIAWKNQAGSGDIKVYVNASDVLALAFGGAAAITCYANTYPSADNTYICGHPSSRWSQGNFAASVNIGTNPATTGAIRLAFGSVIYCNDSLGTTNVPLISCQSTKDVWVGGGPATTVRLLAGSAQLAVNDSFQVFPGGHNTYSLGIVGLAWMQGVFGTAVINAGYYEGTEMTAPAAPAADKGRLYFEDNGSGKTRLMVIFNTGAAQQIAIQP